MSGGDGGLDAGRRTGAARVLVLAAPSGTGKTTVARRLVADHPGLFRFSVSATTRAPRGNEQDGVDYHFLSADAFQAQIRDGAFLEWAEVHGRLYGTPMSEVEGGEDAGSPMTLLDIDVQGALQVKERIPLSLLVFLVPPDGATLVRRLHARGTDSASTIQRRMEGALAELDQAEHFDHVVVNDDLDRTVQAVKSLAEFDTLVVRPDALADRVRTLKTEIAEAAESAP